MKIHSEHSVDAYLYELQENLGNSTDFGVERFTGLVWGKFFCVTHHCAWEWNRRITCEKNSAIGYVKKSDNGSDVRFIKTKGDLRPQILIPFLLICAFIAWLVVMTLETINFFQFVCYLYSIELLRAILTAIGSSITEEGRIGKRIIISLIKNPKDPYGNY